MIRLLFSPICSCSNTSDLAALQELIGFMVLIVCVINDLNLSIEASERIGLIFFLLLGPMVQNQVISSSWVPKTIPYPFINLLFEVSFLLYQLSKRLCSRFHWRHLWYITNQSKDLSVNFLYKSK